MKKRLSDCKMRKKDENTILKKNWNRPVVEGKQKERKNAFKTQRNWP